MNNITETHMNNITDIEQEIRDQRIRAAFDFYMLFLSLQPYRETEVEHNPHMENTLQSEKSVKNSPSMMQDAEGKKWWITLCGNAFPVYSRIEEYVEGRASIAYRINESSSYKDRYNDDAPKCMWGIYSVLACFCEYDDITEGMFANICDNYININDLYELYYQQVFSVILATYKEGNHTLEERYNKFNEKGLNKEAEQILHKCREMVLEHELDCIKRTKKCRRNIDGRFFGGRLKELAKGYVDFCRNRCKPNI